VQRYDQLLITARDEPRNRRPFAYMAAQDDTVWLNFLNSWVTMKKADGYFERLEAKWMPR
jgi:cyclohexadienyl dehydratase